MPACPVPPQTYYHCLDLSLCWVFIINVKNGDVCWYRPAKGRVWVFPLVQGHVVSQHLLKIYTGGVWLLPLCVLVPPLQYQVFPM